MLRGLIKNAVAVALDAAGTEKLVNIACGPRTSPLVIGYHQVVREFRSEWQFGITAQQTSCAMLERHLDWIGQRYEFVSLDEIGARLESGKSFNKPMAAVTFDDGYRDVYLNAFPILKRKGIPAAVFVVTDIMGTSTPPLHDRLYSALRRAFEGCTEPAQMFADRLARLKILPKSPRRILSVVPNVFATMRALFDTLRQSEIEALASSLQSDFPAPQSAIEEVLPLTWEMAIEMSKNGITVGSHTKSHVLLTAEENGRAFEELSESREALTQHLGFAPKHFAYPDGRFNVRTAKAVAAAGYSFAYTTCRHQLTAFPQMTIPRKMLWENSCTDSIGRFSPAVMNCQVHWIFDWVNGCGQMHGAVLNTNFKSAAAAGRTDRPSPRGEWNS